MPKKKNDVKQSGSVAGRAVERTVGGRAERLAARIEKGAATLLAFAEGITEAEWRAAISSTDRRSVGVVVHHIASMYPLEIELARLAAAGKAITEVTWQAVAQVNANHAKDNGGVSKSAALQLLRQNSREAAAVVRSFSDQELDNAVPFSLSFGAPMTTQFVIEDHALRHAWHHLAAIRKALGR